MFSLMVLASYIIKADGKVMHSEMELVRRFLRVNFGEDAVNEGNEILLKLFEHRKQVDAQDPYAFKRTINDCGRQIAANMSYEQRLQLLNFLAMIAKADGHVCDQEIVALREVAAAMGLSASEVDSMLNLGTDTLEAAYKVLEISPSATDDEVKAAYRKLAMKHHPDRVASLGEDVRKAAEEKFRQLNEAKEKIYKARGLN
jgi:DnaJ like chaperone protein